MLTFYLSLVADDQKDKFEELYYKYRNLMYHIAYDVVKNNADAEDAVQQAFIKIAKNIEKIIEPKCHKTRYLIVIIIRNEAITIYNRNKKNCGNVSYELLNGQMENEEDYIEKTIDSMENKRILFERLSKLDSKYQEVLMLVYVHEFSGKETAAILGISHSAVRKRIERGLSQLRISFEEGKA